MIIYGKLLILMIILITSWDRRVQEFSNVQVDDQLRGNAINWIYYAYLAEHFSTYQSNAMTRNGF